MKRFAFVLMLLTLATASTVFGDPYQGSITYDLVGYSGASNGAVLCGPYAYSFTNPGPNNTYSVPQQLYALAASATRPLPLLVFVSITLQMSALARRLTRIFISLMVLVIYQSLFPGKELILPATSLS